MPRNSAGSEAPCVWLSRSDVEPGLGFGFTCQLAEEDKETLLSRIRAFERGELLDADELPAAMWIDPGFARDNRRVLPHLFRAGGFLAVSEALAEVLSRFDLGRTQLRSVEFLHSDRKQPFGGSYFLLNIAEVHRHFSPEHSARFRPLPRSVTSYVASVEVDAQDDDISVVPAALHGPDLWIDDTLRSHFFCSDRLVGALRAAKLTSRLPLYRCLVLAVN